MKIKGLVDEDFVNYRKPAMFIGVIKCNWKCCIEQKIDISICQNSSLANSNDIDISIDEIFDRYIKNPLTKSVVIGGLEPFLQFDDIYNLVQYFRANQCDDDVIIYTGYYKNEIHDQLKAISKYKNIIVKFGRFMPNQKKHFDDILGVYLASDNQYAERIS